MTLTNKNILITGGAGFIGSHLVDRILSENPSKVVIVDNLFLGKKENLDDAFAAAPDLIATHWEDARDFSVMEKIIDSENVDVVFDMAVVPLPASLDDPFSNVHDNVALTLNLCELLRKETFEKLIHFSSSETYGTAQYVPIDEGHPYMPSTPYAASKVAGDQICLSYCETFNIDITTIRPFNNYGPRQNEGSYAGIIPIVFNRVAAGIPIEIYGDGEQTRDLIFVDDTVNATVQIAQTAEARGKVTNVASGIETTMNQLVATILDILGHPDHEVVHVAPRPADVRRHCGSVARAKELIDFVPTTDLASGLATTLEWYGKNSRVRES